MKTPLNLQIIKSISGTPEFVLIPVAVYNSLREQIEDEMAGLEAALKKGGEYVPFAIEDYVDNPVALARIKAKMTQKELARSLGVTQAYISKVERQETVKPKLLAKVNEVVGDKAFVAAAARRVLERSKW